MPYAHSGFDLISLYNETLRGELTALGFKHKHIHNNEIGAYYHSLYARLISCKPREVIFAPSFVCPERHIEGLARLQKAFQTGSSIIPYQSKNISDLKKTDGLFFDWAIHHFHLGPTQYKSKFVGRTGEVAFALVASNAVLFLKIADHSSDADVWTDVDLLEAVHRANPSILDQYEAKGCGSVTITSRQRTALRSVNGNSFVTLSNGKTYISPGGGVVSNGLSVTAVRKDDFIQSNLILIERELNKDLCLSTSYFFDKLSQHPKSIIVGLEKVGDLYFCNVKGGKKVILAHPLNILQKQSPEQHQSLQIRRLSSSCYSYNISLK